MRVIGGRRALTNLITTHTQAENTCDDSCQVDSTSESDDWQLGQ